MDSALVAMLPSKLQGFPCNKMSPTPRPHESFTNLPRSELKGLNRSQESARKFCFQRINDSTIEYKRLINGLFYILRNISRNLSMNNYSYFLFLVIHFINCLSTSVQSIDHDETRQICVRPAGIDIDARIYKFYPSFNYPI